MNRRKINKLRRVFDSFPRLPFFVLEPIAAASGMKLARVYGTDPQFGLRAGLLLGFAIAFLCSLFIMRRRPFKCQVCGRKLYSRDRAGTKLDEPILFICPD